MEEIYYKLYEKSANDHHNLDNEYFSLKTHEERIKFNLRLLNEYKITPDVKNEGKSVSRTTEFKDKANKLYTIPPRPGMQLQLDSVIESYTKSVAYAPPGSQALSLAYANRSAALFTARLYDNCLQDIERALKLDYPDKLKAKLFTRKARCLIALNPETSESDKAVEEARQWLEKMDINDPGRKSAEKLLNDPKQMASIEKPRIIFEDERNMFEIPNDNPEIPGASSAIELKYCQKFGKHVVATRDIEPGEILVVEPAYVSIVATEKRYTHCENCLKQTWSGIPCNYCVEWIYCSEICQQAAWDDHHEIECQVIGPLIALEMSQDALMALRLTVRAVKEAGSLQALKNKIADIESNIDHRTQGFTGNVLDNKKYASVYTLQTNNETRSGFEFSVFSLDCTVMLYMLAIRSNMFGKRLEGNAATLEKNKWVTFVGGLAIRHQQIMLTNACGVAETGVKESALQRGIAIMPFTSLFNHSCSLMTCGCYFGKNLATIATRFITKGDQIFSYYGPSYILMPMNERQATLMRQYRFICECVACRENWPLKNALPSFTELKLPKQYENELHATRTTFEKYAKLVFNGDVESKSEMVEWITNVMKLFYKHIHVCRETAALWLLFNQIHMLRGNRWQPLD